MFLDVGKCSSLPCVVECYGELSLSKAFAYDIDANPFLYVTCSVSKRDITLGSNPLRGRHTA